MQPDSLRNRILLRTDEEIRLHRLPPNSGAILEAVLYRGELPRADAAGIVGTGDRQARRVVSALIERGVGVSVSSRAPLRLASPAALASRWTPGLFPDQRAQGGHAVRLPRPLPIVGAIVRFLDGHYRRQ